jgi:hypothetical protein
MKILRKNNEFRKLPEKSLEDVLAIRNLLSQGWNYCAKEIYKEFVNGKKVKETPVEGAEPEKVKKSDKKKSERR